MNKALKICGLVAVVFGLALGSALAIPTVDLASNGIGWIEPTLLGSHFDITYLNNMISVYNGASSPIAGENYHIVVGSSTPPPNLASASSLNPEITPSSADGYGQSTATLHLGSGGFTYLAAQWDGPNGGNAIYYIGGLSGDITIVNDLPGRSQYGFSGYFTDTGRSVPDGGLTLVLLGSGLMGLALFSRSRKFGRIN